MFRNSINQERSKITASVLLVLVNTMFTFSIFCCYQTFCHASLDKEAFTCKRIKLAVEYFEKNGHDVIIILPGWRKSSLKDMNVLDELLRTNKVSFTPSRQTTNNRQIIPDDRLVILSFAHVKDAVIVSNDGFVKYTNHSKYSTIVNERILMYSIIDDAFLPLDDPYGINGPCMEAMLKADFEIKPCPYKNKCTYGSKCKYYHPERGTHQRVKTAHQNVIEDGNEYKCQLEQIQKDQKAKLDCQQANKKSQSYLTNFSNTMSDEDSKHDDNPISKSDRCNTNDWSNIVVQQRYTQPDHLIDTLSDFNMRKRNVFQESTGKQIAQKPILSKNPSKAKNGNQWSDKTDQQCSILSSMQQLASSTILTANSVIHSLPSQSGLYSGEPEQTIAPSFNTITYTRLCEILKSEKKAMDIMKKFPNETDVSKLAFYYEDQLFFDN